MGNEPIITGKGTKIARVDQMTTSVKAHLNAIANWFEDPKVTLVIRTASDELIFTNDSTADAVAALVANETGVFPTDYDLADAVDYAESFQLAAEQSGSTPREIVEAIVWAALSHLRLTKKVN